MPVLVKPDFDTVQAAVNNLLPKIQSIITKREYEDYNRAIEKVKAHDDNGYYYF